MTVRRRPTRTDPVQKDEIAADPVLSAVYWAYGIPDYERPLRADKMRRDQERNQARDRSEHIPDAEIVQAGWEALPWDEDNE